MNDFDDLVDKDNNLILPTLSRVSELSDATDSVDDLDFLSR